MKFPRNFRSLVKNFQFEFSISDFWNLYNSIKKNLYNSRTKTLFSRGERNVALTRAILMTILRGGFRRGFYYLAALYDDEGRRKVLSLRDERGSDDEWNEMTATRDIGYRIYSSIADVRARIYVSLSCGRLVYASLVDNDESVWCDDSIINSRRTSARANDACLM